MKLINAKTLELEEFIAATPPYAILSHTWGTDEVSYQDFHDKEARAHKAGFEKIRLTCEQALKDGLEYAWVDTCCIDKTSSAELSEAINSMYKWYAQSYNCYVHLADVDGAVICAEREGRAGDDPVWNEAIAKSRWFRRGWTLQELLAPSYVDFYSRDWVLIGTKHQLCGQISRTTKIHRDVLNGRSLETVCVAERMSWAAPRETTREEDVAYSLLGIFGINMPLLYGEGRRAFLRLQDEIIKQYDDHSVFAWCADEAAEDFCPVRGMLARSPSEFAHSRRTWPVSDRTGPEKDNQDQHITMTGKGLRIIGNVIDGGEWSGLPTLFLRLNCGGCLAHEHYVDSEVLGIRIVHLGDLQYARVSPTTLFPIRTNGTDKAVYVIRHTAIGRDDLQRKLEYNRPNASAFYWSAVPA